ncbi:MAG: protein-disulfide reductase DsbD domain-containing protein, partial [Sphingomonadales bacterium]
GWKTYWIAPGEAGLPPSFDWSGSVNVADVSVDWPAPSRFDVFGVDTVGYEGEVVLPLTITLEKPGKATDLKLAVEFMVCERICLPLDAIYHLQLPKGDGTRGRDDALIQRFAARVPPVQDNLGTPVPGSTAVIRAAALKAGGLEVVAHVPHSAVDVFVAGPEAVTFGPARIVGHDADGAVRMVVPQVAGTAADLAGRAVTVVVSSGAAVVAWRGEVSR